MKGILIAGTQSGVGKTTVTVGILGALRARGLRVAPFKAGPDYIDPTYHAVAAGQPSRNLDLWMLGEDVVRASIGRATTRADVAVIEGVMGLHDGRSGADDVGSTAQLARVLGVPVVLVVDASAMGRSAAAMVLGYRQFDPRVEICGVILNKLGSEGHYRMARVAIEKQAGVPVFGGLFRDPSFRLPERHLGLIPAPERAPGEAITAVIDAVARTVDLDALLARAADVPTTPNTVPASPAPVRAPIAIAQDEAFSFYYPDGLDTLVDAGADLLPFSPLRDAALPRGARALYLGGGFPEVYAAQLAGNVPLRRAIALFAEAGRPIYAECGGHMYLGQSLTDVDGLSHAMAGVTPVESTMVGTKLTLGYRVVKAKCAGPVFSPDELVRGHEFHLSTGTATPNDACWEVSDPVPSTAGYAKGNVWSSYLHVHFGAQRSAAARFVAAAGAES